VHAAAVNFPDVLITANRYQVPVPTPFIPGSEFAGVVEEVADDVRDLAAGDRFPGTVLVGAFAEEVAVDAGALRRIPDPIDFRVAAASGVAHSTAIHVLRSVARVRPGEELVVLGGGDGARHHERAGQVVVFGAVVLREAHEQTAALIGPLAHLQQRTGAVGHVDPGEEGVPAVEAGAKEHRVSRRGRLASHAPLRRGPGPAPSAASARRRPRRPGASASSPGPRTQFRPIRIFAIIVAFGKEPVMPEFMYPASVMSVIPLMATAASLHRKSSG
jgi:hypothetical protein